MRAIIENHFLRQSDQLAPLRSYRDNTEIADFPATPGDITRLSSESVNAILGKLNEATNENVNERRDRLRRAVGLQ